MIDAIQGEAVLHSGPAMRSLLESRKGTLSLTTRRLAYAPRAFALHGGAWSCDLLDVTAVEIGTTFGILPNKLVLVCRNGKRETFVVEGVTEWVARVRASTSAVDRSLMRRA